MTAYASKEVVHEASALLKLILTQGRALGVMVVAFVQDQRKETVGMRELFTQTIALRLASASETWMVLGDGLAALAPAHKIARTMPGTGYVVTDDGAVERVRADFWANDFSRMVAGTYPAPLAPPLPEEPATVAAVEAVSPVSGSGRRSGDLGSSDLAGGRRTRTRAGRLEPSAARPASLAAAPATRRTPPRAPGWRDGDDEVKARDGLLRRVEDVEKRLADGDKEDLGRRLDEIARKLDELVRQGKLSPEDADPIRRALTEVEASVS